MPPDGVVAHHFDAMGTTCSVYGVEASAASLRRAEVHVRELAARLTRFDPDSELSRFNAAAGGWVPITPELEALLRESLRAFEMSAGLVNVAVLPAMLAIGYTRTLANGPTAATPAPAHSARPLPDVLHVAAGKARLAAGVGIDLGGIAKGWMADRLAERLGANALVNLGGDLRAHGGGPNGDGWPVGLGRTTVMLDDHAAATSSVLRRRWGDGLHHVIDPRTGRPAASGLAEVSVVTRTAVDAEIVAKTALIAGPDLAPAFCAAHTEAWWLRPS
ncbi:MAG TPA: FAD:protein FMN transferase [Candidatus Dormibacteraeota bacterium]|nr:FAD:protein FMN transferase [Candidatus Dormibacteraeota bacterium]